MNVQKLKVFQLHGGFAPWPPGQGLCPWTPLQAPPPDRHYRLAHSARHGAVLPKKLQARTATDSAELLDHLRYRPTYLLVILNLMFVFECPRWADLSWKLGECCRNMCNRSEAVVLSMCCHFETTKFSTLHFHTLFCTLPPARLGQALQPQPTGSGAEPQKLKGLSTISAVRMAFLNTLNIFFRTPEQSQYFHVHSEHSR